MLIITGTYGYLLEEVVVVRASATNPQGTSAFSEGNTAGALARTVPLSPLPPTRGDETTENQVEVEWISVVGRDTGNSPILSYQLWWDNGTGNTNI